MKKGVFCLFFFITIFRAFWLPSAGAAYESGRNFSAPGSSLNVESLKMVPQSGGGVGLELQGTLGEIPFTVKGTSGSLVNAFDPEVDWPINLTLDAAGITLDVNGFIKDAAKFRGLELNFKLKGQSPTGLEALFKAAVPIKGPFDFEGRLKESAPKVYQFEELYLTWEKSAIRGACTIDVSGDRPFVKGGFFSSHLDLRGFSTAEKDTGALEAESKIPDALEKGYAKNERVFSAKPFKFDFLNALNLDLELIAEKILFPRAAFTNFHMKAAVKNGALSLEPFSGDLGGGLLDGRLILAPDEGSIGLSAYLNVHKMDLKSLLDRMELKIAGEGQVDFNMEIESKGRSLAETMAALNGSASLVMGKGRIDREYLKYIGFFNINLISAISKIIEIPGKTGPKETTSDVNCFAMRFDFNEGLADLSALVLDTPYTLVVGNGNINLATEKIAIYIKPISKEGIGAKGLAEINLSLAELTRPFSLGGTLANPRVSVDTTRTFLTIGKAIGGAVLFGPAGVAVALISGKVGSRPENPCLEAIEAAEKGVEIDEKDTGAFKTFKNFLRELSPIK